MIRFKDIRVIDLDEEATKPTHRGWTVCFRLSANTPDEWRKVFRTVMSGS